MLDCSRSLPRARKASFALLALSFLALLNSCRNDSLSEAPLGALPSRDSVLLSFAVLGCNRVDKSDADPAGNPSTANLVQLDRSFTEIAAIHPDYLFVTGDMVLGYTDDSTVLARELTAWRSHYEASPLSHAGVRLVVMPGNHESMNPVKIAQASAERQWLSIMAPYIAGSNGPKAGGLDSLGTDQSRLTYSFNDRGTHFLILNTDPVGREWRVPWHWIQSDLREARNAGMKHIFALGHKPAYPFDYESGGNDGLSRFPADRDSFWTAFESAHADAMITAHNHIYRRLRPDGKSWMIIAGNGGSPLEKAAKGADRFYGFTLVQVLKNGNVIERSYGRDLPAAGYKAPIPAGADPTTLRDSALISW